MLIKTSDKTSEDRFDEAIPIPTQVVSNGEYLPIPPTPAQQQIRARILAAAEEGGRRLGVSRRDFLRSSAGMATAFAAINTVHGCGPGEGFVVDDCETRDPEGAREAFAGEYFILDSQTHHVDLEGQPDTSLVEFYSFLRSCPPKEHLLDPDCVAGDLQQLSRTQYLKEIFVDSETTVAMMSGVPAPDVSAQAISNDGMAMTRDLANEYGASERCILQGMVTPNFPDNGFTGALGTLIRDMPHLVEALGIKALKTYTGAGGPNSFFPQYDGWWLDDEEVAYPMFEEALRLGVDVVNTHKGFTLGIFDPDHVSPRDIPKAARDWPEMRFVVFHSAVDTPPNTDHFDELIRLQKEEMGDLNNVYTELGGAFALKVLEGPDALGVFLGELLLAFGEDRILWGTDSIWWGSPQWQINALKTFVMPEHLLDQGYPDVTPEVKAKIFGLNAAALYRVDPDALRCSVPSSMLARTRALMQGHDLFPTTFATHGPTSRRDFFRMHRGGAIL